ncbi:MAG: ABC transporter permease [Planctomycetota bacterium]
MLAYVGRRLALAALMLLGVVLATFLLHHALPGDPAAVLLGKNYNPADAARIHHELGLDDPLPVQFGRYLGRLAHGDLGRSHVSNEPVTTELARVLPATLELAVLALLLATVLGVGLGVLTALRPRSWWDVAGLVVALAGVSLPIFWLGFLALEVFGQKGLLEQTTGLAGLPLGGRFAAGELALDKWVRQTPGTTGFYLWDTLVVGRDPGAFLHVAKHLLLPTLVLSSVPLAVIARITRAAVGEALIQDYIRTARAKGLPERWVVMKHALRNAAIPVVTTIGTQLGYLLGGAVLTETIFSWPGMGRYVTEAILNLDVKPLQACVLVVASGFVLLNLLVDLSYAWLDPRLSEGLS